MKRKPLLIISLICMLLLITSCNNTREETPQVDLHEMIMVKNEIWKNTGFAMNVQVDEDEVLGEITSTVQSSEMPSENGQANFEIEGSKYSLYGDNIVVLIDSEWILFLKEEDWINYDMSINNTLSIDYSGLDEDIFGDLSKEEIENLFMDIANAIYEDEDYESNLDSIIENVFIKYGIDDSDDLNIIKSELKISRPNSN